MKRFLCLSLCLGVLVSACKKKNAQENVDAARAANEGTGGITGAVTTTIKQTKEQVLQACLPQINALLITTYGRPFAQVHWIHFFLRKNTNHNGTAQAPVVVLYTSSGVPLEFAPQTESGLGITVAAVTRNLEAMAKSAVIQNQFVEREVVDGVAPPGYRIHISVEEPNEGVDFALPGEAPVPLSSNVVIYDPESIAAANVNAPAVVAEASPGDDIFAGWYDCAVDETTEEVTLTFTQAVTQL